MILKLIDLHNGVLELGVFLQIGVWLQVKKVAAVIAQYPANLGVVQQSLGVIVHSEHARQLAESWYGRELARRWQVVALPRAVPQGGNRQQARQRLALAPDDFVVCSFGLMGATKLNERLLEAWLLSPMSQDARCRLIFVGEAHAGDYGAAIEAKILSSGQGDRISRRANVYQHDPFAATNQIRKRGRGDRSNHSRVLLHGGAFKNSSVYPIGSGHQSCRRCRHYL